ncbi:cyclic-phosphate processing receiver domain-containing protein [Pseudomonas saponiphila]
MVDERQTPPGWIRTYWPDEVIALLETGGVEAVSLDHDLGDDSRGTGYDVILWIEEAVALHGFCPPQIHIHSVNASAVEKMRAGVQSIYRLARNNGCCPPTDNR